MGSSSSNLKYIHVNNVDLAYEKVPPDEDTETPNTSRPIILLHCNYSDHTIFDHLIKQLKEEKSDDGEKNKYVIYAVDSAGHGKSSKPEQYSYYDMMEDIYEFIQALHIHKPILYGYSDGGILGLLLASKYPDVLSSLIVSGANLDMSGQTEKALRIVKFGYFITRDKRLRLILDQPNMSFEMLKNITVPTLVLAGSDDMIREEHTRKIASFIANSELKIVEGEGHGSYIAHSDKVYFIIKPFLDKNG